MSTILNDRYPGIRSFEAKEQELFFGRSDEIRSLYAQVKVRDFVVLFSKSGIGKSSLLNAGLIPLLELEPFIPVKTRFQDIKIKPVEAIKNALKPYIVPEALSKHAGASFAEAGVWECMRACRFERYGEPAMPVLFFDQFEEFFTHPEEERLRFIVELADIASKRLPNRVRDHLLSIPLDHRSAEDMEWHLPIDAKIVIAIRSDRLSLLDDLSLEIPLILQNRFQLKPLNRSQASDAITEPATLPGSGFKTQPFVYQPQTLEMILNELTNKDQEIEPFQLQLICHHIEQHIFEKQSPLNSTPLEVDQTIVGGREDIQSIINDYYERAIEKLPDEYEEAARHFIETGLIVGGKRVGITEGVEKENFGINAELLALLVDSRLIRIENTHLGRSIEISHDTLVGPILQSYEKRRVRLEKEAAIKASEEKAQLMREEMEQQAREQQLKHEKRLRKFLMVFAIVAGGLAILAVVYLFKAINRREAIESKNIELKEKQTSLEKQNIELETQKREVQKQKDAATEALEKYKEAELELVSTKVDVYLTANQPDMALKILDSTLNDKLLKLENHPIEQKKLEDKKEQANKLKERLTKTNKQ